MGIPLRTLIIEDSENDALLLIRTLQKGGYDPAYERVETADAMNEALGRETWDVILSDYNMPHFSGLAALKLYQEKGLDIPFIIVSGTIGEETAIAAMVEGAHDYMMKNNLPRLVPAIQRELRETKSRRKRKQAEQALRESEERYRSLIENIILGITLIGTDYRILMTNTGQAKLFNKPVSAFIGKQCFREFEKRNEVCPHCPGAIAIATGRTAEAEATGIRDDGSGFSVHLYAFPIFEQNGEISGFIEVGEDITDRKQAEELFRSLVANSPVGVYIVQQGKFVYANPQFQQYTGYRDDELLDMKALSLVFPEDRETVRNNAIQMLKGKRVVPYEFRITNKNGEIRWALESIASIQHQGKQAAIGSYQEITEHKQAEQQMLSLQAQLQQSQKMEAIGRLAGGVAHDFNNLLTVISVQAQLALRGLREADPLKEKLKDIEQAADRAANLTRQLLAFSRRQILEMKVINLNAICKDLEKMLRRVIGEDIECKTVLAEDLGMVKVDPGQMEQVIVNLAVNAKDAMPQGGKLILETANAELDEGYTRSHVGVIPGAYVMLSITDTGIGMSKEVREQIFDPFFTTKEKDKGTGLGLSTVYGIVKQSGGDIYVYSEPGKGTTFKIYFPRVFEAPEEVKRLTPEETPRGKETLLVVEDDQMVRRLAVDILRKQGYRVLEATEGGEALLICEKEKRRIDLILSDIVMPHIGGPELIERLKKIRQDFKVLYMTGYTDEMIGNRGVLEEGIELIHKPFTIEKLSQKVRGVLDKN